MGFRDTSIHWPLGKRFAFSIFDDTDNATVEKIKPVYQLLNHLGIKTTKSVWPLLSQFGDRFWSQSLQDAEYLEFILQLQEEGFEIGYHGARAGDNPRNITKEALDLFREKLGHDPQTYAQHAVAIENIYWGRKRTGIPVLKAVVAKYSQHKRFYGDDPKSRYFWADLCKERIKYVRNYGFARCNVLEEDRWTPYKDPHKPWVNYWFSTGGYFRADLADKVLSPTHIDEWEQKGALVIVSAHLAQNYTSDGRIAEGFERGMRRLAERNGWFVPVATILDYILKQRGDHNVTAWESGQLQLRWARDMARKTLGSKSK